MKFFFNYKAFFLVLFTILFQMNFQFLWADSCIPQNSPLFIFIDDVFLQIKDEKSMQDSYKKVKKQLKESLELAYLDYYLGRYYQSIKSLSEMEVYDSLMLKGKVFEVSNAFKGKEEAIKIYEKILTLCEKNLNKVDNIYESNWFLLETRIVAEMCLIAGPDFMLANGLEVPKRAQNFLKKNPNCMRMKLIQANQRVFSNKIWGGSPKKALSILSQIEIPLEVDKELMLDYYNDLAYSYGRLKDYEMADKYIRKALEIYPSNLQANFIWSKIQKEDF